MIDIAIIISDEHGADDHDGDDHDDDDDDDDDDVDDDDGSFNGQKWGRTHVGSTQ